MASSDIANMFYNVSQPTSSLPPPMSPADVTGAMYGGGALPLTPATPLAPLPSWIPQDVQSYIRGAPSYDEGQAQGPHPNIAGGEPYSPTPQIDDINRLFAGSIGRNAPTSQRLEQKWDPNLLRSLIYSGHATPQYNI